MKSHFGIACSPVNFSAYIQNTFSREHLWKTAFEINIM